jgi:hypothetical protein
MDKWQEDAIRESAFGTMEFQIAQAVAAGIDPDAARSALEAEAEERRHREYDKRFRELNRRSKPFLADLHVRKGGLMGYFTYIRWTKEELIKAILEDEGFK